MKRDETMFLDAYNKLNKAQKEAVDTIDGPVMVVAGPGTGKTQILSLRIANILRKTDTESDGILCLTFTNSGVSAMRERLRKYIGGASSKVEVSTFHSFAMKFIEQNFEVLGYVEQPSLIDDVQAISLSDFILSNNEWEHLTTRTNKSLYFRDIKSLISLLKRERLSPDDFLLEIQREITTIKNDESNISSRGESKGKLKQEALRKIEGLERTEEVVKFYSLYELTKKEKNLLDYDDVLEELVKLVEISEDARDSIREKYLYVLVDEHQDSSGVQNDFLSRVWGDVESPNIFVVGDDRQLIYGFGGASLSYFEGFKEVFKGLKLITLTENYRSTQKILDVADTLLKSSLSDVKLLSQNSDAHPLRIIEAEYPRDEILRAGLEIQEKIKQGTNPNDCAILVPKNKEVRSAIKVLEDLGLPVASSGSAKLFTNPEAMDFLKIFEALAHPETPHIIAPLLLSPISKIPTLSAHKFLAKYEPRKLTLSKLLSLSADDENVEESISDFANLLASFLEDSNRGDIQTLIQKIGEEFLIKTAKDHKELTKRIEIIRTLLHLAISEIEKNTKLNLHDFLLFIDRLKEYDTDIPLAVFESHEGIKVMTLHSSKGLEFESVYICHLDEKNLLGKKNASFTLPEKIKQMEHKKDEEVVKRELYVAITRAKKYCTLSYSVSGYTGASLEMSHILSDLPAELFDRESFSENEKFIMSHDIDIFVKSGKKPENLVTKITLAGLVKDEYFKHRIAVTHLNNFFECPWKWYFRNFLKLPEPETMSLEFGNLVHGTLEKVLKKKIKPNAKSVQGVIEEKAEKLRGFTDTEISRMKKEAESVVMQWIEKRLPNIENDHESEKSLFYRDADFEHLQITGKIDLVEKIEEGVVRVTDFKTGGVKKKGEIEKDTEEGRMSNYRRQLAMYTYLIDRTTEGQTRVVESRLEFLEGEGQKDAMYVTTISSDDVKALVKDINDFDQLLSSGDWVHRECNFKAWKSGEVCEYCKLSEIYKK